MSSLAPGADSGVISVNPSTDRTPPKLRHDPPGPNPSKEEVSLLYLICPTAVGLGL